jgi:hypothetical protein
MDRRNFLQTLIGGVAGAAAVRTWPFRVYSFPTHVIYPAFSDQSLFEVFGQDVLSPLGCFKSGRFVPEMQGMLWLPVDGKPYPLEGAWQPAPMKGLISWRHSPRDGRN